MEFAYTYTSKVFPNKQKAEKYLKDFKRYAKGCIKEVERGFVITCGLGDEDELCMFDDYEMNWRFKHDRNY